MFVDEKQQGEAQPVKVGTLKLSEAIRIGAKKRPQCKEAYFSNGGSCAWGAAVEGLFGVDEETFSIGHINAAMSAVRHAGVVGMVIEMNDTDKTREEIADWLESHGY